MAGKDGYTTNEGSRPIPAQEKKAGRKSWAEEHGGLILLIIVASVIFAVTLFELCLY